MKRWFYLLAAFTLGCASGAEGVGNQTQPLTAEADSLAQRPLASTTPTRFVPTSRVPELAQSLSLAQQETTAEELATAYSYVQEIGDPDCAWTEPCGSGGGEYTGCVFGFCAWCQTWALCHFENGDPNPNALATTLEGKEPMSVFKSMTWSL